MIYDLIVVGGGPGGATAAKIAAESNANVLLLEAGEEGRYKCCAGGIPARSEDFSPIPHGVGEREVTGGVLFTPKKGPMEFEASGKNNKGYCMFRTDFDKYLLDISQDAGAQVIYESRVKRIEIGKNKKVKIVGTKEFQKKMCDPRNRIGGSPITKDSRYGSSANGKWNTSGN